MHEKLNNSKIDFVKKLFTKSEIRKITPVGFKRISRFKIIVFVPDSHVEVVFETMSQAGAGVIGEYTHCSFRTKGTGTFKPVGKAIPFSGKRSKVNHEAEIKLEMECSETEISEIISVMKEAHPYEEVAYEIYPFFKLVNESSGMLIELNKRKPAEDIFKKLNKQVEGTLLKMNFKVKTVVVMYDEIYEGNLPDADIIIINSNGKIKIKKQS